MLPASSTFPSVCLATACAISAVLATACGSDAGGEAASPCVAFAKAPAPAPRVELLAPTAAAAAALRRVSSFESTIFVLDAEGRLARYDAIAASGVGAGGVDFAVGRDGAGALRAFVARWSGPVGPTPASLELVRYASADGGSSFDPATEKIVLTVPARGAAEAVSLALAPDGALYLALGDVDRPAGAAPSLLGTLSRLDVSGDAAVAESWGAGLREPRGLDVDAETGDVWLTDISAKKDATLIHRVTRASSDELSAVLTVAAESKRAAFVGGHVYRGAALPALAGKYVYPASGGGLVAVDRFGPSGTPQTSRLELGEGGSLARGPNGALIVVAPSRGLGTVVDGAPAAQVPTSLLATRCFDLGSPAGVPAGAIPYDVTTPLWSDGAAKDRWVVVPKGTTVTARADGDLLLPVGTVAVKTFAVDGKRVETRLYVQHDREDWVGYSYAWNDAGTDAELVNGNRVKALPGGKRWYFPSSTDCTACHTPAAGYTLGIESKQLAGHGDALARLEELEEKGSAPVAPGGAALVGVDAPPPATAEARARSYLHANCSACHREGSATGTVVDLDLRIETPLEKTGLCKEAQAGTLGLAAGVRIVAAHDPASSVLVARMRTLDDRRMPKLASRAVDESGLAAVEAWIRELTVCP